MAVLSTKQIQFLKAKAHKLKPVVMIGSHGLTEGVLAEIVTSITHHELIKIKIAGADKATKEAICHTICAHINCSLVQIIGNTGILYLAGEPRKIELPKV